MSSCLLLLLSPKDKPIINLSFSGALPDDLTFMRASAATDYDNTGRLVSYGINEPRFSYDPVTGVPMGLLIEPQATNLFSASNTWTSAYYEGSAEVLNDTENIDGAVTARRIYTLATSSTHGWDVDQPRPTTIAGTTYSISCYIKNNGYRYHRLALGFAFDYGEVYYDFTNDEITAVTGGCTATSEIAPNGFVKITAIKTTPKSATNRPFGVTPNDNYPFVNYLGDGVSGNYVSNFQMEVGGKSTSYIPTTGTAATRAADILSFTIPNGVEALRYTFDDDSTQDVAVSSGPYTVPTNLNRPHIKRIVSL